MKLTFNFKWPSGFLLGLTNGIIGFTQPVAVADTGSSAQLFNASKKAHTFQWWLCIPFLLDRLMPAVGALFVA